MSTASVHAAHPYSAHGWELATSEGGVQCIEGIVMSPPGLPHCWGPTVLGGRWQMPERILPGCCYCSRPAEGVLRMSTSMGGQEPRRATCRACADADIDLAVEMNVIRSAGFATWAELETSAPDLLERFVPRR